jgi:DnaJ-class molecular chaperone
MPDPFSGYEPRERVKIKVQCRSCKGTGDGPSGRCIHTGEWVDGECPDCKGSGKVEIES